MKYKITKEQCEKGIKGVCEGCGGPLSALETVDNSGQPTFWQGCEHCSSFRNGVDHKYFKVARMLVENNEIPTLYRSRINYEDHPEKLEYYFDSETCSISKFVERIHKLLIADETK